MGWNDIPKPKQTSPGDWEDFSSVNFQTWVLRCGPGLLAQIKQSGGLFYTEVNENRFGAEKTLADAQRVAENAIVEHVKKMLPPYKAIMERAAVRASEKTNVTPLQPKK
jgi:hypothetical protein